MTSPRYPTAALGIENRLQIVWQFGVNLRPADAREVCGIVLYGSRAHFRHAAKRCESPPGKDADILLWDPKAAYTISLSPPSSMATDYSMFEGWKGYRVMPNMFFPEVSR